MKISVALCTYNGEKFIAEQLKSILEQKISVDEIVICDDNSKDNTVSVCEEILSKTGICYRIVVNNPALGVANNFLKCLKLTTGDYVFTCDQDDVWYNNKVEIFLSEIEKSEKLLYFSNGMLVDADNRPLNRTLWDFFKVDYDKIRDCDSPFERILERPIVTGAAMCLSRKLIDKVDIIPEGLIHDEWFSLIASLEHSITPINKKTFNYRQHGNNVIGATEKSFKQKFLNWINGFYSVLEFRRERQKRSIAVLNLAKNTEFEGSAREYYDFWNGLYGFKNLSRPKQILKATKYYFSGKYNKYFVGFRSYLRDLLIAVLLKNR